MLERIFFERRKKMIEVEHAVIVTNITDGAFKIS